MIVSFSLPADLRPLIDAEAARQRRSRSFIVAEAVRQYLSRQDRDAFAAARQQTLREGLALTPTERVRLAERLWRELGGRAPTKPWTAAFDTFADYEAWRRHAGVPAA